MVHHVVEANARSKWDKTKDKSKEFASPLIEIDGSIETEPESVATESNPKRKKEAH